MPRRDAGAIIGSIIRLTAQVSEDPPIVVFDDFVTEEECAKIIEIGTPGAQIRHLPFARPAARLTA